MTLIGTLCRLVAFGVVVLAVVIAVAPNVLYTELPSNLTLDFDSTTVMVVTGANSGVGLATVQHYAHNPHCTILMACRDTKRCEAAKVQIFRNLQDRVQANLIPMKLDLSHKASIEAFAKELQDQPIHVLVNNAGLAGVTEKLNYHEDDGVEHHIRTNHLGHVYLTHCLWKNLQLAGKARIVMVSSLLAALPKNVPTLGWYKGEEHLINAANLKMYGRSKRANLMFAAELHERYGQDSMNSHTTGISVVAAHPGFTQTDLCRKGCKGRNRILAQLSQSNLLIGSFKMTSSDGALPQAYAAVVPQSGIYIGPKWLLVGEPVIVGGLTSSWHHASFTKDESQALWTKSLAAMQIKEFGEYEITEVQKNPTSSEANQEQAEPVQHSPKEIPVREEPVHRDDPVHPEEPAHHSDPTHQYTEPEPEQVYEESEVNDQGYARNHADDAQAPQQHHEEARQEEGRYEPQQSHSEQNAQQQHQEEARQEEGRYESQQSHSEQNAQQQHHEEARQEEGRYEPEQSHSEQNAQHEQQQYYDEEVQSYQEQQSHYEKQSQHEQEEPQEEVQIYHEPQQHEERHQHYEQHHEKVEDYDERHAAE